MGNDDNDDDDDVYDHWNDLAVRVGYSHPQSFEIKASHCFIIAGFALGAMKIFVNWSVLYGSDFLSCFYVSGSGNQFG